MHQDFQLAARAIRRSPAFALAATATLTIAFAAAVALFTLVDAVLLRPLAYPDSDRLLALRNRVDGISPTPWGLSQAQYFDFGQHASSFEKIGVYVTSEFAFSDGEGAEQVTVTHASASLLEALHARSTLGRIIREEDTRPGANPVVVLGHEFWVRRLGADSGVVGRLMQIEGRAREVVGVLAPRFDLPDRRTSVWLPLTLDPGAPPVNSHFLSAIGRLRRGASVDQARAELTNLVRRYPDIFARAYSPSFMRESRFAPEAVTLHESVVAGVERMLWVLLATAGLLLLIACANVANLFLVRFRHRSHELGIRMALGADVRHVARLTLTEALIVTLAAGAAAILIASVALGALLAAGFIEVPRADVVAVGWRGVLLAVALSVAAGTALGLMPVIGMRRHGHTLVSPQRSVTHSRGTTRLQNGLVVAQVALSVVLLAAGGLMTRSVANLLRVEPGLDPNEVVALAVSLPAARYGSHELASRFYESLLGRIRQLPGVLGAGATTALPLAGAAGCAAIFVEDAPLTPGGNPPCVPVRRITPGYFETLDIAVRGSTPDWSDTNARTAGAVVSRALAQRLWPGQTAIGKGIRGNGWARPFYRVTGVTEDVREAGLDQPPIEAVYFPMVPMEGAPLWAPARRMTLVVRTQSTHPETLVPAIRRVLTDLDREVPLGTVMTMTEVVARSMIRTTAVMVLLGIGAGVALLLGAVGLYGLLAYKVSSRYREIGIRAALGSGRRELAGLIVREALALTGIGVLAGITAAALTTHVLDKLLFGIGALDPITLAAACLSLLATALVASYLPARRAAIVDPIVVLRAE